jgi:hypothetical protein
MPEGEVTITLTTEEYDRLLILMGFAVGAAYEKDREIAYRFLELANRVNRGNPHWRSYEIPDEFKSETEQ